jgi:hypothetical protein
MSWIAGVKAERELDACLAEVKSQGAVLKLGDLRSPRPAGTQFFEGAAEESALGLLLAKKAESMSDGPRKTRTLVTTVFEHSPHECEMARDLLREKRELINDIKEISVLPPTGMEDILRLTGMREAPFLVRLPNLLTCRYFVNLLVLDACVAYEEGRPDDALASCAHILRLGRHVQDIPSVLCLTMGSALQGVGVDFLTKIIVDANFSEDAMQSFSELLDPADTRESLAMAYAGELVVFRQHFARWPLRVPFVRFITAADEKAWIVILSEASRNARLPYYKADNDGLLQENQDLIGWNTPIARVGIPNVLKAKRVQAFMELELIQLRVALAVNRCKRDTGAYPESASTLVPKYLETTTINPLTGKPVELEYMNAEAAKKKREDDSHRYRRFFTVGGPRSDKRLLID